MDEVESERATPDDVVIEALLLRSPSSLLLPWLLITEMDEFVEDFLSKWMLLLVLVTSCDGGVGGIPGREESVDDGGGGGSADGGGGGGRR